MHERRNFVVTLLFMAALVWGVYAWVAVEVFPGLWAPDSIVLHRIASVAIAFVLGGWLVYAYRWEDKFADNLGQKTMGVYYECDGLCFAPFVRVAPAKEGESAAEISLYYQSRFAGPCEAVIHLRPPQGTIHSHPGARDVHFAFTVPPGAFGVVHQPVAVEHAVQGEPIKVQLAAQVRWPHGHGDRLRSRQGRACGTFNVDWALAFRQSRHELGGEIELKNPATMHLTMPEHVRTSIARGEYTVEVFNVAS